MATLKETTQEFCEMFGIDLSKGVKPTKVNKYRYLTVLQGDYGYGWDDLMEWDSKKDDLIFRSSHEHLKWYRDNEKHASHRIIKRRELNK